MRQHEVARNVPYFTAYFQKGRVGTIHSSEANLDRHRVAALGRAKAHFTGPRRRHALIYFLASAIIPLIGTDAFSNAAHKQVASHHIKAAKAETSSSDQPAQGWRKDGDPGWPARRPASCRGGERPERQGHNEGNYAGAVLGARGIRPNCIPDILIKMIAADTVVVATGRRR